LLLAGSSHGKLAAFADVDAEEVFADFERAAVNLARLRRDLVRCQRRDPGTATKREVSVAGPKRLGSGIGTPVPRRVMRKSL
jgi:hypothetical protein